MFKRKILLALGILGSLLVVGTGGYVLIEGWSFLDSMYMAVITMTTVGFKEVAELSRYGKIFTIGFAMVNFIILAGVLGVVGSAIIEGRILGIYRRKKMEKKITRLKKHTIICGAGTIGSYVMREIERSRDQKVVLVENDFKRIEELQKEWGNAKNSHTADFIYVHGDATREETLSQAGIESAQGLVTCLADDSSNLFVALTARKMSSTLRIAAEVQDEENVQKFFLVGVNEVVSGDFLIARKLALTVLDDNVAAFLDQVTFLEDRQAFYLSDVCIPANSHLSGKSLAQAAIPQHTGLLVIAVRKQHQEKFVFNPNSDTLIETGDVLIFMGSEENQQKLKQYLK